MKDLIAPRLLPEIDVKLSEREVEVLRWTADGKTSNDVADILGISERTVNFHINNAMIKLGASNKTAAAVRAAVLGLL
ncbi:helix-turn-helix transcriptional regulator [Schlegelella sp. S2-27]|uniref:Helix-turn-helix transcriptional regulator n=1 Tax=Caldimonas mangrovi TaxID=2944811 RepID=A0ABT0YL87_9BURK|nr:helix-turn-helix transcriptional regulator [Caldimonas mangrovi]MCM5679129.1 helix-turn-helix transcriptional regulator [Caldimonas mangrovi]